jgi:type VI secretion system protein VasJ
MHLICGVGRDSVDSIGRSFPLVIMGTGRLPNWESRWDLLPVALDKIWHQMEHLCTKRFLDFKHLENDIQLMLSPVEKWTELNVAGPRAAHYQTEPLGTATEWMALQKGLSRRQGPMLGIIPLSYVSQEEQPRKIAVFHAMLKEQSRGVPNAVFMGGVPEKTCLVIFSKPVRPDDFRKLWSACSEV